MEILKIILFIVLGLILIYLIVSLIALYHYKDSIWPSIPKADESKKHIACIGDSITFGAGVIKTRNEDSYPAQLQKLLKGKYQVLNYGYSGRTLLNEGDHPYKKEKQYAESLKVNADYFIIMLGTNDSKPYNWNKEKYEEELDAFIKEYKNLSCHPKLIVMQPSCCFATKKGKVAFDIDNHIIESEIHDIVRKVSEENNVYHVLDLYTLTKNHPEYFADGVHPNKLGNEKIAEYVSKYIV